MTYSENDFCEMHSSNFTGICCFRKLHLKKKEETSWLYHRKHFILLPDVDFQQVRSANNM